MEKMITYLKERYNNTPMIIIENGRHILKLEIFSADTFLMPFSQNFRVLQDLAKRAIYTLPLKNISIKKGWNTCMAIQTP